MIKHTSKSHSLSTFSSHQFLIITLLTSLWVQTSEVFRYLVIVRPEMQEHLSIVPDVANMTLPIFLIWGVWGTLLTGLIVFLFWLCAQAFGNTRKTIFISGTISWCFFFVLFWVGMANMNLSAWEFVIIVLPLALIETLIASFIASRLYSRYTQS